MKTPHTTSKRATSARQKIANAIADYRKAVKLPMWNLTIGERDRFAEAAIRREGISFANAADRQEFFDNF